VDRKVKEYEDLWGICKSSDIPLISISVEWDDTQLTYRSNRSEFSRQHRAMAASLGATRGKQVLASARRLARQHVCGALAGPIAEAYNEALRRPEIWARVIALADELERVGDMCPDALVEFLPQPDFHWPPSVVTNRFAQAAVDKVSQASRAVESSGRSRKRNEAHKPSPPIHTGQMIGSSRFGPQIRLRIVEQVLQCAGDEPRGGGGWPSAR
jgi:hypothetical protein